MPKLQLNDDELREFLSSLSAADAELFRRLIEAGDVYSELLQAAADARLAISELDESREVAREELCRPINLL